MNEWMIWYEVETKAAVHPVWMDGWMEGMQINFTWDSLSLCLSLYLFALIPPFLVVISPFLVTYGCSMQFVTSYNLL